MAAHALPALALTSIDLLARTGGSRWGERGLRRINKRAFCSVIGPFLAWFLVGIPTVHAEEIVGRVKAVSDKDVEIEVDGDLLPRRGDNARIFQYIPNVGEKPLSGTWRVLQVRADLVLAIAADGTIGEPKVGSTVKFESSDPQLRSGLASGSTGGPRTGAAAPADDADLPSPESIDWDHPLSVRVFELSCNSGTYWDCARLAAKFRVGRGVPEDLPRAAALFGRACDGGVTQACGDLGYHYVEGKGVERDASRGADLYRRACDADAFRHCRSLAALYATGEGVRKSIEQAAELFRKACEGGEDEACDTVRPYYAAAAAVRNMKSGSPKEFQQFAGLSNGDKVEKVYELFGDPERVEQEELDGGRLGLRLMYRTPEDDDLWVVYDQRSKRVEIIGFACSALPWLETRVRDEKIRLLCSHESVPLAKWGAPEINRDGRRVYRLPGGKNGRGAVRLTCADRNLNVCSMAAVEWWRD